MRYLSWTLTQVQSGQSYTLSCGDYDVQVTLPTGSVKLEALADVDGTLLLTFGPNPQIQVKWSPCRRFSGQIPTEKRAISRGEISLLE